MLSFSVFVQSQFGYTGGSNYGAIQQLHPQIKEFSAADQENHLMSATAKMEIDQLQWRCASLEIFTISLYSLKLFID